MARRHYNVLLGVPADRIRIVDTTAHKAQVHTHCSRCGHRLSIYNRSDICGPCEVAIRGKHLDSNRICPGCKEPLPWRSSPDRKYHDSACRRLYLKRTKTVAC